MNVARLVDELVATAQQVEAARDAATAAGVELPPEPSSDDPDLTLAEAYHLTRMWLFDLRMLCIEQDVVPFDSLQESAVPSRQELLREIDKAEEKSQRLRAELVSERQARFLQEQGNRFMQQATEYLHHAAMAYSDAALAAGRALSAADLPLEERQPTSPPRDQIREVLERADGPLTARQLGELLAPAVKQQNIRTLLSRMK